MKLWELYIGGHIVLEVKIRSWGWLGHVKRMSDSRMGKVYIKNPGGSRPRGMSAKALIRGLGVRSEEYVC